MAANEVPPEEDEAIKAANAQKWLRRKRILYLVGLLTGFFALVDIFATYRVLNSTKVSTNFKREQLAIGALCLIAIAGYYLVKLVYFLIKKSGAFKGSDK